MRVSAVPGEAFAIRHLLERASPFLYIVPALAVFTLFTLYPIVANVGISFLHYSFSGMSFAGLANYRTLVSDPVFWQSVGNSLLWVVGTLAAQLTLGYLLAWLIEEFVPLGRGFFRTIFFLPMVITPSVISIVFSTIYSPDYGLLYGTWEHFLPNVAFPGFLSAPSLVTWSLILVNVWQWTGFFVLLYVAGLGQISSDIREAARLDGAKPGAVSRFVYLPMLRPTHLTLLLLGTIQALQQFPLVYLITNGGPDNASQIMGTYVFQQGFIYNNLGYASTVAVSLFVLALGLAVLELRVVGGRFEIGGQAVER